MSNNTRETPSEERERQAGALWARAAEIAVEAILKEPDKKEVYLDRLRRYRPFMN